MPKRSPLRTTDIDRPAVSRPAAGEPVAQARFRLRITVGDLIAIGPGKIALLEAVERTGSITAGAKAMEMSYRRAWMLLDALNGALQQPAVESAKGGAQGGGSALTDVGRELLALYRRIEDAAIRANQPDIDRLLALLAT